MDELSNFFQEQNEIIRENHLEKALHKFSTHFPKPVQLIFAKE